MYMRLLLLVLCLWFNTGNVSGQTLKILFVGNSLTYTNDLPSLVEKEAKSRGVKIKSTLLAFPNYAIVDHWNDGELQKHIISDRYDYVVIQQGPSSQSEGRKMLMNDGARLKRLCESNNAQLVYFMVWPSKSHYHTFDGVIKNHMDAANENDALLCPVGKVWKEFFDQTGDFSYYGMDGFHPSLRGSQVAAEVIVNTLLEDG